MGTLLRKVSRFQEIEVTGTPARFVLWLDGHFQLDSATEAHYHQLLANLPMALARGCRAALVLGGGDGLAARECLKYPAALVVNVEIDPEMAALARMQPLRRLNRGSFGDRRAEVVVADALEWVPAQPPGGFDVVVADFPAATTPALERLFAPEFHRACRRLLAPGGVLSLQVSEEWDDLREIRLALRAEFGHAVSLSTRLPSREVEKFVYASAEPFAARRPLVEAPYAEPALERLVSRAKDCLVLVRE